MKTFKSCFYSFNYLFNSERAVQAVYFSRVARAEDRQECLMAKCIKYVANYQNKMFLYIKLLFSSSNVMLSCVIIQGENPHNFCNNL